MAGGVPGYYITKAGVPGGGAFRGALNYYAGQEFGPAGKGPGALAGAQATDAAAGQYYSTPTPAGIDPSSGAAAANAQGAFGNLLSGEAAANNATAATNAQTKSQAGQGILAATQGYGSDIAANVQAQMALSQAQDKASLSKLGLFTGLLKLAVNPDVLGFSKGIGQNVGGMFGQIGQGAGTNALNTPQSLDSGAGPVPESPQSAGNPITESSIGSSSGSTGLLSNYAGGAGLAGGATTAGGSADLFGSLADFYPGFAEYSPELLAAA